MCDGWLGGRLPNGALTCSLHTNKVSLSILGSQQALLTQVQVCGAFALLFGFWLAGRWMGGHLGPCRILGNLCGLWICVRVHCSFATRLELSQSCVWTRSTVRWMVGWPSANQRLNQINRTMDGWMAICQAAPRLDWLCDGWLVTACQVAP